MTDTEFTDDVATDEAHAAYVAAMDEYNRAHPNAVPIRLNRRGFAQAWHRPSGPSQDILDFVRRGRTIIDARSDDAARPRYLGNADPYDGLDWLPTTGRLDWVTLVSDEVTAKCPVTGQPDMYTVEATYVPTGREVVESKSWKLFLQTFRDRGIAAEELAVAIGDELTDVGRVSAVDVTVKQKARGGVAIEATYRPFNAEDDE